MSLITTLSEAKAAVDDNNANAVEIFSFKDLFVIVLFLMFVVVWGRFEHRKTGVPR
jgi:hypothetical protein